MKFKYLVMGMALLIFILVGYTLGEKELYIKNENDIADYIAKKENLQEIKVLEVKEEAPYVVAFYKLDSRNAICIFQKSFLGLKYFGGGTTEMEVSSFSYNESGENSLIIIYGDNRDLKASKYMFENESNLFERKINNDYILDIYRMPKSKYAEIVGGLFNENGEKLLDF